MSSLRAAAPAPIAVALLVAIGWCAAGRSARAAEVAGSGSEACTDAAAIAEQASDLLGRPPASVAGVECAVGFARLAAGREVAVVLGGSGFRIGLGGFAYLPRVAHVTSSAGGEVDLLGAAADACAVVGAGSPRGLACGGFELGRLSAQGVGISRPRLG